ncbi:MAG TPA: DedA family protein [Candidatus Sulfotelmatobacter sp.]|nr:DedA family protein [Candidatus Sulfotelmatobacter sp.]
MSLHVFEFLRHAIVQYGYWAVACALLLENAGLPLPGETVLLLASFLAYSEHELRLSWIIVVGIVAATAGDNLGYGLGQYGGRPLLERYQHFFRIPQSALARGERWFLRFGSATILFARFIFGMRVIAGPLAGVLRMPWRSFFLFNFLGASLWVSVIATLGYLFGQHWHRLERGLNGIGLMVAIFLVVVAIGVWKRGRRV